MVSVKLSIIIVFIAFILTASCSNSKQNALDVNFSFAVCPSIQNIQATPFQDESGKISLNISCGTSYLQLTENIALIIYGDGNISIAPIEGGRINVSQEEYLIKTISLLHKQNGEISSKYTGIPGRTQDLVSFPEKTTIADITLVSGIGQNALIYEIFNTALGSIFKGETKGIVKNNIILLSSYLSTKNLSNIPFLIFDEIRFYTLNNYKISDVILNFPENITTPNGMTEVILSPPSSIRDIDFITPPLLPIIPDINLSSIQKLSERKTSYQLEITQNQILIPIFLANVDNQFKINFIGKSGDNIYFGKLENITQTTSFMDILPPSEDDIETTINFVFPEGLTEEVFFELYPKNQAGSYLLYKEKVSKERRNLKIRIPKNLISDSYYVKTYMEKKQKLNENTEISETFERYEISEKPFVYHKLIYLNSENFSFDAEISGDKIFLFLLMPQNLPIDDLSINPQSECLIEDLKGKYISRDCISSYVEIYGTDDANKYQVFWKIYNLDKRNKSVLPNLFDNKEVLFEAIGSVPKIKIREISFKYIAFSGNTIISYTKSFRYVQ